MVKTGNNRYENMRIIDSLFEHNIYDGIDENYHFSPTKSISNI